MAGDTRAWGGRFRESTAAVVEAMNASVDFDKRLAIEDIAGSIAHSRMLSAQGLITPEEQARIEAGLADIAADIRQGRFEWSRAREDVHMNVEGALADRLGRVAGKLHTGRSRNDQVALDLRLWLRRQLTDLGGEIYELVTLLIELGERWAEVVMPGYTHLQRAQPITLGHHLMAYAAMFLRDLDRLVDARRRAAVLPLGSGALAGSPLPLDRWRVARELAFPAITFNSLDGVSDRDPALETLGALSIFMVHVSRLAEELVLWTSQEFGFVELSDAFCTGSSLMPQKKNADIAELLRGKAGRVFGSLQALLTIMKGLPLAYNKDMQEDKEPLFDAVHTARQCAGILPDLLRAMTPRADRMRSALRDGFLLATDLADYLVDTGMPFREAHHVVGEIVARCLDEGWRLEDLDAAALAGLHPAIGPDAVDKLDVAYSIGRRTLEGGPAPAAVREAAVAARAQAGHLADVLSEGGPSAIERALREGGDLPSPVDA
ncbi:MAG: argininosuccinate lyase [Proteobacteria bacterium]|nr:MAG: argininosuccinate lyase [Pseudomonadota bacterium]